MISTLSAAFGSLGSRLRTRAALGLRPATTPVMVFVPLGFLLGPWGLGTLTPRVIAYLDPVISVALATLGVFVGIAVGTHRGNVGRLIAASTTEGIVTLLVVGGAVFMLVAAWVMPLGVAPWLAAAALGLGAAASAAPFVEDTSGAARRIASQVADLDDVLPIVLGGIVVSIAAENSVPIGDALLLTLAVGVGVGIAGWLLFEDAAGAERGVFVIGTLVLLGGASAYAGVSPLATGMVAGFIWALTPGHTDRIAATDLRKAEHPLIVLLLIVAGAGLQPSVTGWWLVAPFVLFRTSGKLLGGWIASRVAPGIAPADLGAYLLPPGVLGIGFILNFQQVALDPAVPLVFAVAAGAVASEIVALLVIPAGDRA